MPRRSRQVGHRVALIGAHGPILEEANFEYRIRGEVSTSRKVVRQQFTHQVWSRGMGDVLPRV